MRHNTIMDALSSTQTSTPDIGTTRLELAAIAGGNPYPEGEQAPTTLLVAFLAEAPDPARVAKLAVPAGENVRFTVAGREIYLHYPDGGYGRTKFHNTYLEKQLGVVATTRNWKTLCALRDMTTD